MLSSEMQQATHFVQWFIQLTAWLFLDHTYVKPTLTKLTIKKLRYVDSSNVVVKHLAVPIQIHPSDSCHH